MSTREPPETIKPNIAENDAYIKRKESERNWYDAISRKDTDDDRRHIL